MVTEDYVSFETAKLLKEKGFLIHIPDWYYVKGELTHHNSINYEEIPIEDVIAVCTQQTVMKWLREEKRILIFVLPGNIDGKLAYISEVWIWNEEEGIYESIYASMPQFVYEKAIEADILYCLKKLNLNNYGNN